MRHISIKCNIVGINVFTYERSNFHITLYLFIEAPQDKVIATYKTAASVFRTDSKTKYFHSSIIVPLNLI